MFCQKCGQEIDDEAVVCVHCGCAVTNPKSEAKDYNKPKTGMGILMALLLGLIGLLIGVLMYPDGTVARKSFIKSWAITFGITAGIAIIAYIIILAVGISLIPDLPTGY